jgi:hypothetical protein
MKPLVRPLSPYAQALLKAIPYAPDDVPSWQLDTGDFFAGKRVTAALQQLKRRGLIVVSPRRTSCGKRWQRPNEKISRSAAIGWIALVGLSMAARKGFEK